MAVFEAERAEANTEYHSPEGSPIERVEIPVYQAQLEPTIREALGKTVATFAKVEVRGGIWTYYSESQFQRSAREGIYTTSETGADRVRNNTFYSIHPDGRVHIGHERWDPKKIALAKYFDKNNSPEIKSNREFILADFLYQPYGLGATVKLEPVPGTDDQTQPVLRYTEVRPESLLSKYQILGNPDNSPPIFKEALDILPPLSNEEKDKSSYDFKRYLNPKNSKY